MSEHVIHRSVFLFYLLICLAGCTRAPLEVQAPIDASGDTEDAELRAFVSDMYARSKEDPNSPLHRGRLGMVYDANGFTEAAVLTYRQAGVLDDEDMRWPYLESLALSEQGRIQEAVNLMDTAIQLDSSYLPAYLAKGYWMIDLGEFASACDAFERASQTLHSDSHHTVALQLGLAQCHFELGETEEANQALDTLPSNGLPAYAEFVRDRISRARDGTTSFEIKGIDVGDLGQISWRDPIAGAVVEYTRGLSNEALLAQKLIDGGRADDALYLVESLRERHPNITFLIELHSAALIALDRRNEAINILQQGLARYPEAHLLHFNLGLLLETTRQLDAALDHYSQTIKYQDDFVPAYDAMAKLLIAQHETSRARELLESSLEHRKPDATTFYLLGVLFGGEGDWSRSATYLTKASELEPENVVVLSSLALTLSELGRVNDAKIMINLALDLEPGNPKVQRAVDTLVTNGVLRSVR